MDRHYGNWNLLFWIIFIVLGVILILISRFDTFLMGLFMGLIVIILGIQKIAEDEKYRRIHMKQDNVDKKLHEISAFVDRTYGPGIDKDGKNNDIEEIKKKTNDNLERMAKKMIQLENKLNQIQNSIVDNWGRIQEQQIMAQAKQSKMTTKEEKELKEKLKKAMSG
ncbi:MAG: hypothetical protein ABIF08_03365 [Nanoarchaeota archaeon]